MPELIERWSLTSLRERLIKSGARLVRHGRYAIFQMAEVTIPRDVFAAILNMINTLRGLPSGAAAKPKISNADDRKAVSGAWSNHVKIKMIDLMTLRTKMQPPERPAAEKWLGVTL